MSLIMFVLFLPTHLHHSLDFASMGICVLRPRGRLWALSISGYVNMGRLLSPVMLPFLFPFYEKRMVTAAPYWIFGTLLLLYFFLQHFLPLEVPILWKKESHMFFKHPSHLGHKWGTLVLQSNGDDLDLNWTAHDPKEHVFHLSCRSHISSLGIAMAGMSVISFKTLLWYLGVWCGMCVLIIERIWASSILW